MCDLNLIIFIVYFFFLLLLPYFLYFLRLKYIKLWETFTRNVFLLYALYNKENAKRPL